MVFPWLLNQLGHRFLVLESVVYSWQEFSARPSENISSSERKDPALHS
jgi:hypothetical protein